MTGAAIVVTHNSEGQVERCVSGLLASGLAVSIVDNASGDETVRVATQRLPAARLLVNGANVGFAAAVNRALAATSAEAILLVNPDCAVPPATVRALLQYLAANPGVGVVAPRLRDAEGRTAVSAHPFERLATVLASRFGGSLLPMAVRRRMAAGKRRCGYEACHTGTRAVTVDWVSGACLAIRGSLLRRLGGLDSGYFLYYEDEELCLQAWRAGASVVFLPTVEAVHVGGASSHDPAHTWPHLYRSLLRFHARHRPRTFLAVRAAVLVRALLGISLGAGRDATAVVRSQPARRTRAWAEVARIAAFEANRQWREAASCASSP